MAVPTWGMLEKSQTDPEKIEEAIARLIQEHNEDEEAHLGVGGSLYSHKMAEIIDHLIASIVQDKIADGQVNLLKLVADQYLFITAFETLDGWTAIDQTHGGHGICAFEIRVYTNAYDDGWSVLAHEPSCASPVVNFAKSPMFQTTVKITSTTNQTIKICVGDYTDRRFGFKIVNGTLYASHHNGSDEYTTEITGITITDYNVYRAVFDSVAGNIKFYVNGVLKATHSSNLPSGTSTYIITYELTNTAAESKNMYIRDLLFSCGR